MMGDIGRVQAKRGHARRARRDETRRRPARRVAAGAAGGEGRRQDARDPHAAGRAAIAAGVCHVRGRRRGCCLRVLALFGFCGAVEDYGRACDLAIRALAKTPAANASALALVPPNAPQAYANDIAVTPRREALARRCACIRSAHLTPTSSAMPTFHNGPIEIAYLDTGEGDPIVLVHGFGSNKEVNWVDPGWVDYADRRRPPRHRARQSRPRRVDQALRSRANTTARHGGRRARACSIISRSSAPTSWAIRWARASRPISRSRIQSRMRSAILGGIGKRLITGGGLSEPDRAGARGADRSTTSPIRRASMFRRFAEQTKSDRLALAACIRGGGQTLDARRRSRRSERRC